MPVGAGRLPDSSSSTRGRGDAGTCPFETWLAFRDMRFRMSDMRTALLLGQGICPINDVREIAARSFSRPARISRGAVGAASPDLRVLLPRVIRRPAERSSLLRPAHRAPAGFSSLRRAPRLRPTSRQRPTSRRRPASSPARLAAPACIAVSAASPLPFRRTPPKTTKAEPGLRFRSNVPSRPRGRRRQETGST